MTGKQHAIDVHHEQAGEFEERYRRMDADKYSSTFTYGRAKIERIIEAELAARPRGQAALDVGCGTGFNLRRLGQLGFRPTGIEPAVAMRELAQRNNPGVEVVDGDIEAMPFADGSFDILLAIEVIRYLADPRQALRECARVLRPGGVAFITAAPRWSLNGYALLNELTGRVRVPGFTHVRHSFMSASEARSGLTEAGFEGGEVHGVFFGPWHALQRFSQRAATALMRACEPFDEAVADRPIFRDLSNHLVLVGRR